jgi:hypothetical protein
MKKIQESEKSTSHSWDSRDTRDAKSIGIFEGLSHMEYLKASSLLWKLGGC